MLIWKFHWKKMNITYPLGVSNIDFFALTKCPVLHAISAVFAYARAYTYKAFQVCKNLLIDSWHEYVKFWGMIPMPSALLWLLKRWWTMANKLLANCYRITPCDCETAFISYMLLLRHVNSSHVKGKGAPVVLGHVFFIMGSVMLLERRSTWSVGKVP